MHILMFYCLVIIFLNFIIYINNEKRVFLFWVCRETHLWYIIPNEVKSTSLLNQYLELLSPCEKENVFRMCGNQPQKRALLASALVRTTSARCRSFFQLNAFSHSFFLLFFTCFVRIIVYYSTVRKTLQGSLIYRLTMHAVQVKRVLYTNNGHGPTNSFFQVALLR